MTESPAARVDVASWPTRARKLAVAVERRARASTVLQATALLGGCGAAAAALLRSNGSTVAAAAAVGAGLLGAGVIAGLVAARRLPRVDVGDAAWALDRLAGARERGLTAAVVTGPAGAEAAWSTTPISPPVARLLPPRGLAPVLGSMLLLATALAWPGRREASDPSPSREAARRTPGDATEAARADVEAASLRSQAQAQRRQREALGLGPLGNVDPAIVAERLGTPEARKALEALAPAGSDLARALEGKGPGADAALASALGDGGLAQQAEALSREAASLRSAGKGLSVPASRRDLVARYLADRLARRGPDSPR